MFSSFPDNLGESVDTSHFFSQIIFYMEVRIGLKQLSVSLQDHIIFLRSLYRFGAIDRHTAHTHKLVTVSTLCFTCNFNGMS